tara:strand:- start:754 stop:1095 length:342 start_codon:yes stop_codon:yes gene_type:complete
MPKAKISKEQSLQMTMTKHIKWMRSLGLNVNDNGHIIKSREISINEGYYPTINLSELQQDLPQPSNKICGNGKKVDNSWKIEVSKNFTIVPAYNKGPYMVVNKTDLKTAGRKV